jgi:uncharacterized protein YifN (PemK superfamily)
MILEEATKDAFGYYPRDLKPKSAKLIIAACECCGEFRIYKRQGYKTFCSSCVRKGKITSEETKRKLSEMRKGKKNPMYGIVSPFKGKHHTDESKHKLSEGSKGNKNRGDQKGDKNSQWRGGISFEPYCVKFNEEFKEYIRSKFGHKCFLCPTTQAENGKKLSVHHVNYNKDCGCDGDKTCNFVPLCKSCHTGTNTNREYWQKRITDKLHCLIIGWGV